MGDIITDYIEARHIDSFQKLHFLLFLHEHPDLTGTSQELAERLYHGYTPAWDKIIADLYTAGLLERVENCYKLRNEPDVQTCLQSLARLFEDALARQKILDQVRHQVHADTRVPSPLLHAARSLNSPREGATSLKGWL